MPLCLNDCDFVVRSLAQWNNPDERGRRSGTTKTYGLAIRSLWITQPTVFNDAQGAYLRRRFHEPHWEPTILPVIFK